MRRIYSTTKYANTIVKHHTIRQEIATLEEEFGDVEFEEQEDGKLTFSREDFVPKK